MKILFCAIVVRYRIRSELIVVAPVGNINISFRISLTLEMPIFFSFLAERIQHAFPVIEIALRVEDWQHDKDLT
ncbi:MAG TPA: hypothetical protein VIO11_00550 [Candidatus Methanoperedens sp.]